MKFGEFEVREIKELELLLGPPLFCGSSKQSMKYADELMRKVSFGVAVASYPDMLELTVPVASYPETLESTLQALTLSRGFRINANRVVLGRDGKSE